MVGLFAIYNYLDEVKSTLLNIDAIALREAVGVLLEAI